MRVVGKGNYRWTEVTLHNWRERNVCNMAVTHYGILWYSNAQWHVHMWSYSNCVINCVKTRFSEPQTSNQSPEAGVVSKVKNS